MAMSPNRSGSGASAASGVSARHAKFAPRPFGIPDSVSSIVSSLCFAMRCLPSCLAVGLLIGDSVVHASRAPRSVSGDSGAAACEQPRALVLDSTRPTNLLLPAEHDGWLQLYLPRPGRFLVDVESGAATPRVAIWSACDQKAEQITGASTDAAGELTIDTDRPRTVLVKVGYEGPESVLSVSAKILLSVSGKVTDEEGLPLAGIEVRSFAAIDLRGVGFGLTDSSGFYSMGIPWSSQDGGYFVRTGASDPDPYLHEVWDNVPCGGASASSLSGCGPGTAVLVGQDDGMHSIDFALGRGASIEGRVVDAVTGLPLPDSTLWIASSLGGIYRAVLVDGAGRFRAAGFPPGSEVYLLAQSYEYEWQLFDGIPCPNRACALTAGTPVTLSAEAPTWVEFRLQPSSYIEVDLSIEGVSIPAYRGTYHVVREDGLVTTFRGGGDSRLGPLAPGTYYVRAEVEFESFDQVYDGVECDPTCPLNQLPMIGAPIIVDGPGDRPRIAMDLRRLPTLRGRVTDLDGAPVANASVSISGRSVRTDVDGDYIVRGISTGSHRVFVDAVGFVDQLYPDVDCESDVFPFHCLGAEELSFGPSSGDRMADFVLHRSPRVHGKLRSNGLPLPNIWGWERSLRLYTADGNEVAGTVSSFDHVDSSYELTDFPPGDYYIRSHIDGYYHQLANGVNCLYDGVVDFTCPVGAAQVYSLGSDDVALDFDLVQLGQQVLVQAADGTPLPGVALDVWNEQGYSLGSVSTDATGRAVLGRHEAFVFLSTDNDAGYIDEVHSNIDCPRGTSVYKGGCGLDGAAGFSVPNPDPSTPPIVFSLEPDPTVFQGDFEDE